MSQELEALKSIKEELKFFYKDEFEITKYVKEFEIIEKTLKGINEILENHNIKSFTELNERLCDYNELKFDDDIKQKKLQAFEIIKKYFWLDDFQDFVALNGRLPKSLKEEFDLLKEALL